MLIVAFAVAMPHLIAAQTPMKPTAPGTTGDPAWQGTVRMADGRTFITDGGLAIDAGLANLPKLPERVIPGTVMERYFSAPHSHEYGFGDLTLGASGRTYTTPDGLPLNATYIKYLRRILPSRGVRLLVGGDMQPVVIVSGDKPVGVLMPVKK